MLFFFKKITVVEFLQTVTSTIFQISMMFFVLLNAFVNACFIYKHDRSDEYRKEIFYYIEVGGFFVVIKNLSSL